MLDTSKEKLGCYFGSMGIGCRGERADAGGGCASTDFSQLRPGENRTLQCRETAAPDHIDRDAPQTGQGFFYLVRFAGTYGSSSSGLVRVPSSGDCP